MNVLAFVLAAPFIYAYCRRVASAGLSAFVAGICMLMPVNAFTAYFMPESLYFLSFWIYAWATLRFAASAPWAYGLIVGAILGLAALVKVHAVALAAAFALFVLSGRFPSWRARLRTSAAVLAPAAVIFVLVRFGLGYALAGRNGLSLVGSAYAQVASQMQTSAGGPGVGGALVAILTGHLMLLTLLAGVPLAALLMSMPQRAGAQPLGSAVADARRMAVIHMAMLLALTVYFSASIVGPYESAGRLHARYYDFALPLLYVVAASMVGRQARGVRLVGGPWPALLLVAVLLFVASDRFSQYSAYIADAPELTGLYFHRRALSVLAWVAAAALALWAWRPRLGAAAFVMVAMPAVMTLSSASVTAMARERAVPNAYDEAGRTARAAFAKHTDRVAIAGSGLPDLYKALFQLDDATGIVINLPEGAPLKREDFRFAYKRWVVVLGRHPTEFPSRVLLAADHFQLIEAEPEDTVFFREAEWPDAVASVTGLGRAETWGRWSVAPRVVMAFRDPLPERFVLRLQAHAFERNAYAPITVHVGAATRAFVVGPTSTDAVIEFDGTRGARTMSFDVPAPVRPRDVGIGLDDRSIGLALESMRIEPR